jgi:hypothetical protein
MGRRLTKGTVMTVTATHAVAEDGRVIDVEQSLAAIEKGQQLAGHFPSAEDMEAARKILTGEITPEEAEADLQAALARIVEAERAGKYGH